MKSYIFYYVVITQLKNSFTHILTQNGGTPNVAFFLKLGMDMKSYLSAGVMVQVTSIELGGIVGDGQSPETPNVKIEVNF